MAQDYVRINLSLHDSHMVLPFVGTIKKDDRGKTQHAQSSQRIPATGTPHYEPLTKNSTSKESCAPKPFHGRYTPDAADHDVRNLATTPQPGLYVLEQHSTEKYITTTLHKEQHFLQHPKQVTIDQIRKIHLQLKHATESQLSDYLRATGLWDE